MERRTYPVKNFPVKQLAEALDEWYQSMGYETQVLNTQYKGIVIQARRESLIRAVIGMSSAITVTLNQKENYLAIEIGGANWADKAAAAAIGVLVFLPTLFTAGFGTYEQGKVLKQSWDVIHRYIMSVNAGAAVKFEQKSNNEPYYSPPPAEPSYGREPFIPPPTAMIEEPFSEVPGTKMFDGTQASWGTIIIDSGPHTGEVHELKNPKITIGRNRDCNIILSKDDNISRNHACIYLKDGEPFLSDQGSSHGTFLNEKPVTNVSLKDNSIIQCGRTIMRFCIMKKEFYNM